MSSSYLYYLQKKSKNDEISKMYIQHTLKCINIYINPFPSKLQNLKVTVGCAVVSYGLHDGKNKGTRFQLTK